MISPDQSDTLLGIVESPADDSKDQVRRAAMVQKQLREAGIRDERVLQAMAKLPRQLFIPPELREQAYQDSALTIGFGQTISQPYMVALMLSLLELSGRERVLDVGTGSGYQAALLGLLARHVYSVELVPELATQSRNVIEEVGFDNVTVALGNGSIGLPQAAPYDAIVVAAGAPGVPDALLDQLDEEGIMVIPTGSRSTQVLLRIQKHDGKVKTEKVIDCAFVPLKGDQGWSDAASRPTGRSSSTRSTMAK